VCWRNNNWWEDKKTWKRTSNGGGGRGRGLGIASIVIIISIIIWRTYYTFLNHHGTRIDAAWNPVMSLATAEEPTQQSHIALLGLSSHFSGTYLLLLILGFVFRGELPLNNALQNKK
jgi:hypothetical protein